MSIISQETWNKFTEEEKEATRNLYSENNQYNGDKYNDGAREQLELLFDKNNLVEKPIIKIWPDVERAYPNLKLIWGVDNDYDTTLTISEDYKPEIVRKAVATFRLYQIMELGYGGLISNEEWTDKKIKYIIEPNETKDDLVIVETWFDHYNFIAFHTRQQAEEFMSFRENVNLAKDYYLMKYENYVKIVHDDNSTEDII